MVQSQFSLTWDSYKNSICHGFSSLQQNGEFVDMTLAADGHFVKVHQLLLALVSPYLKELITSAPCQHPVVFLNNVSYKTLSSLLEYIYTGEVLISFEDITQFMDAAKSLCIRGLENVDPTNEMERPDQSLKMNYSYPVDVQTYVLPSDKGVGEVTLPVAARKIHLKREKNPAKSKKIEASKSEDVDMHDYSVMIEDSIGQDSDDDCDTVRITTKSKGEEKNLSSSNLQYSVSIRGSLQVILNRYIYNQHSVKRKSGIRRWRCVEYRNHRCPAFVVTKGNVVLNRANLHNHSFHDKKILQKIDRKAVFSALEDVQVYKEKEQENETDNEASSKDYGMNFSEAILGMSEVIES